LGKFMSTSEPDPEAVARIIEMFPGAELEGPKQPAPSPASMSTKKPHSTPRLPKFAPAVDELVQSTMALVAYMRDTEPERFERKGWQRIAAAVERMQHEPDFEEGLADVAHARGDDPSTSQKAADMASWRAGSDKWKLCEVFFADPKGMTAEEGIAMIRDDGRGWQRVSDLVNASILVETGAERMGSSGAPARVLSMSEGARRRWVELGRS